jgi:uncharacterized protein YggE
MRMLMAGVAVSVLFLAAVLHAQQPPTVTAQTNTIYVSAEGRYETPPDVALLQFNIAAQEETAKLAYERASNAAEEVRRILRNNGVEPKNAEIGFFSISPIYDWRSPKRRLVAYRVSSSVILKLHDFSKIAPIVQQLSDIDITENQSLSYTLENMDTAKIRAVEDALQRARDEAMAVARTGGRTLGELSYSSVDTYEQVRVLAAPVRAMARAAMAAEAAPPPTAEFSPQRIVVTARISALFAMR